MNEPVTQFLTDELEFIKAKPVNNITVEEAFAAVLIKRLLEGTLDELLGPRK